ncbi:DUF3131 domain-containing protein [Ferrimonas pelagia]|uniref:DUF3131 domain-containing protein n=1 Tax=Ferrimonas pelagia TaxID=1177826 RepID=A0ABP9FK34_9GAMM
MMSSAHIFNSAYRHATIAALVASLTLSGCGLISDGATQAYDKVANGSWFWQGRHGALTEEELEWASIAWQYIDQNTDPKTGLVGGVNGYPTATMGNVAEYLASLHVAYQLGLVDHLAFDGRLSAVLHFLNTMDLFDNRVPNRVYHTQTTDMVNYANEPGEIGWSGLEVGRLLIWLNVFKRYYPPYGEYIDKALLRWDFCALLTPDGEIQSGYRQDNTIQITQDGRLGYEEYAAYGYSLWGFNPMKADVLEPYQVFYIYGMPVLVDGRDPRVDGVPNPLVSTPFFDMGLEFNWDRWDDVSSGDKTHTRLDLARQSEQLYRIQEARWRQDAIHTARAEHILSGSPWFLYDAIWAQGSLFASQTDEGDFYDNKALLSVKAAFLMWALWDTEYTDELMSLISPLHDPEKGWFEGRFEQSAGYEMALSLPTNATVLKALLYKQQGKLLGAPYSSARLEVVRANEFELPGKCHPIQLP